jgi:hypothetical protein
MASGAQPCGHQLVSPSSDVESLAKADRWNRFKPENYENGNYQLFVITDSLGIPGRTFTIQPAR